MRNADLLVGVGDLLLILVLGERLYVGMSCDVEEVGGDAGGLVLCDVVGRVGAVDGGEAMWVAGDGLERLEHLGLLRLRMKSWL